jgi:hypothetical protein
MQRKAEQFLLQKDELHYPGVRVDFVGKEEISN